VPDELFLRRTVIGGQTAPGDYLVIWDELPIGRIFKSIDVGGGTVWSWSCSLPNVPQPSSHRGRANSLDQAKADFRKAWADLQSRLSHREIAQARAIANDHSRPWHKRETGDQD
jgi:hypothetical protein